MRQPLNPPLNYAYEMTDLPKHPTVVTLIRHERKELHLCVCGVYNQCVTECVSYAHSIREGMQVCQGIGNISLPVTHVAH